MTDQRFDQQGRPTLQVSEVGEFVRFHSCLRRAKLAFNRRAEARQLPFYSRLENTLDVVLRDRGLAVEGAWERQLGASNYRSVAVGTREAPIAFAELLAEFSGHAGGSQIYGREISISGQIGQFAVEGRMDFVVLLWRNERPVIRIVEGKASRRDKTYQRMQTAAYLVLARSIVEEAGYVIGGVEIEPTMIEAVVARVDEDLREPQDILTIPALDLTAYGDDLARLLGDGGSFVLADETELDALPYRLEPKCDACVFNVHCFPETGRQRRIQLLSPSQSTARALAGAGIHTVDDLADLQDAALIADLRRNDAITDDPLRLIAKAAARRKMLPGGREQEGFAVAGLPMSGRSQCPEHELDGRTLVRTFLNVDYDYVEDRIASVTAYVTNSSREIRTPFGQQEGGWRPSAGAFEADTQGEVLTDLTGRKVSQFKTTAWTGNPVEDAAAERQLLESFFQALIEAIADVGGGDVAPLHFYVWSPSEMTRLMEGCARGGASLIRHLSELFGCRPGREQLIYTALQPEVDRRYGLGWTGRGLGVATNLLWFGKRFHWVRSVRGAGVELDRVFHQDIFDFASTLRVNGNDWADEDDPGARLERFEIRSRFNDSLSMPYYAVGWNQLNSQDQRWQDEPLVRAAIRRYEAIRAQPGLLRAYLETRCEALRFIEERCTKNARIEKPTFDLRDLGAFMLGVNTPRAAAIDVLRIDWQVKFNEWLAAQALTSGERVSSGRCLPLSEVHGNQQGVTARIAPELANLDLATLQRRYSEGEGSFVRLMPWSGAADQPAELNGAYNCIIDRIDWRRGVVDLSPLYPARGAHYRLFNAPVEGQPFGLLEQSATDYIAPRVEARLTTGTGGHVDRWFDLSRPVVTAAPPAEPNQVERIGQALRAWRMPPANQSGLHEEQASAAIAGLGVRIQALQGPPGTGKTATTAAAIFARAAGNLLPGDRVILAGPTHRAVDTMTERLARWEVSLREAFRAHGVEPPPFRIIRVDPRDDCALDAPVQLAPIPSRVGDCTALIDNPEAITLLCGTTNALLKLEEKLGARASLDPKLLVVDEASMMVFPHLLALASLTQPDARIMVAGDNRQLSPILAHGWDREDRPPTIQFQPFLSAYEVAARIYEAVRGEPGGESLVSVNRLRHTFRLAPAHRSLIGLLYRAHDGLELEGREEIPGPAPCDPGHIMGPVWSDPQGLILILHNEHSSRKENALERQIVRQVLEAYPDAPAGSVAILSPHRGQRGLLREDLDGVPAVAAIDTVERLQGGEAPTVIVTATASDPGQIQSAEDFLLNINRSNVAFSRAEARLVIIASEALLDHVAADLEVYEAAMLWKEVRRVCSNLLSETVIDGHRVRVMGCPPHP